MVKINTKKKKLTSSMEDYLEAIAAIKAEKGVARVKDISKMMGVKKPSVTSAVKSLCERGLIIHERYGYVDLTRQGEKLARSIRRKHDTLVRFISRILGVDRKIAAADACKIEHHISPETFERLTKFVEFVKGCPDGDKPEWLKGFDHYHRTGKRLECKTRKRTKKRKR
ncbi:MAG: MarR family transcriptional regulator [Candidatus Omnitrophica bacterium]|nr:MarR family transcriptional regulator [Candidatus Omnitrophota bacterium]